VGYHRGRFSILAIKAFEPPKQQVMQKCPRCFFKFLKIMIHEHSPPAFINQCPTFTELKNIHVMKKILFIAIVTTLTIFTNTYAQTSLPAENNCSKNIAALTLGTVGSGGNGVGITYEHFLDEHHKFSCYVPFLFTNQKNDWHEDYEYGTRYLHLMPGFRYYPGGHPTNMHYAIGLSMYLGYLWRHYTGMHSPGGSATKDETVFYSRTGMTVSNSIHVDVSRKITIGFDIQLGFASGITNMYYGGTDNPPITMLLLSVGYKF
jgi:hypothetical protein